MAQLDDKRLGPNCQDHSEGLNSLHCGHSNQSCYPGSHLDQSGIPNCPQCKPKLVLENAGPGDVAFHKCSDRKLKASKSCLQCLTSDCELHPQNESQIFHNYQLVEASAELQENTCTVHRQVKEVFCLSDQQCICCRCANDEHQGHDTVLAAKHRTKMQKDLGIMRCKIQQKIQDTEKCVKQLQKILELEKKLQQEISDLRRTDTELEQLSHIKEDNQFLLRYSALSEPTHSADTLHHPSCLQEVWAAVLELTEKLQSQDHTLPSVTEKVRAEK